MAPSNLIASFLLQEGGRVWSAFLPSSDAVTRSWNSSTDSPSSPLLGDPPHLMKVNKCPRSLNTFEPTVKIGRIFF